MRFAIFVLAATLVVAAGTGCSEDKQAGSSTTAASGSQSTSPADATATRPTPPEDQSRWAQQVDDACKPWQEKIDAVSPAPSDVASLESWLEQTLPLLREQLAAVKAVKPPAKADEARKRNLFLNALHKTERALTRYLSAIRADAPAKVRKALADAGAAGAAARAYAVSLDLTQCGGYSSG